MVILNYLEDLWLSDTSLDLVYSKIETSFLSACATGFRPDGSAVLVFVSPVLPCRSASRLWLKARKQNFP